MVEMVELDLGGNHIDDVEPLASMVKAGWISLDYNHIQDLTPLKALRGKYRRGVQYRRRVEPVE